LHIVRNVVSAHKPVIIAVIGQNTSVPSGKSVCLIIKVKRRNPNEENIFGL